MSNTNNSPVIRSETLEQYHARMNAERELQQLAAKLARAYPVGEIFDSGEFPLTTAQATALEAFGYIQPFGNCWKRIA